MFRLFYTVVFILILCPLKAQDQKHLLYLLSGQGSDDRIYKNLNIDSTLFDVKYIPFLLPVRNETMESYAYRMSKCIDTNKNFSLIGVSLGGMVCIEMTKYIHPKQVILISSASSSDEIPGLYSFFKFLPIHQFLPAWIFKTSTFVLQPIVEPDRRMEKEICKNMIADKDALFIKRATHLIVSWNRTEQENERIPLIQIHGTADHTLPLKQISADYLVGDGSHLMLLTQADTISLLLQDILIH